MDKIRNVSATAGAEASELRVLGAVPAPDNSMTVTVSDASSWPSDVDFITFARNGDGTIEESTRVVWIGQKIDDANIKATRTGGSSTHVPSSVEFAATVPTHRWADDLTEAVEATVPNDGLGGVNTITGPPVLFHVGQSAPSAVPGRTVLWIRPLD